MTSESDARGPWEGRGLPSSFGNLYPRGYIIAPVPDRPTADALADQLRLAGFPDGDVYVFDADIARQALEELEQRRHGVRGRLGAIMGNDNDIQEEFTELARKGFAFVVIHAPDEAAVARASPILRANNVRGARHYGRLVVTDM